MPNGCCETHADGPGHSVECWLYWPCGHRKDRARDRETGPYVLPHTCVQRYVEVNGCAIVPPGNSQVALGEQLSELANLANQAGLYDAADWIKSRWKEKNR